MECHYCHSQGIYPKYPLLNSEWKIKLIYICDDCYKRNIVPECCGCGSSICDAKYIKVIDNSIVFTCSAECSDRFITKKRQYFT